MGHAARIQGHGYFDRVHLWVVQKIHGGWVQRPLLTTDPFHQPPSQIRHHHADTDQGLYQP